MPAHLRSAGADLRAEWTELGSAERHSQVERDLMPDHLHWERQG